MNGIGTSEAERHPSAGRRRPRVVEGKYVLAGLLRCAACGGSMHGATLKNKPYCRCNAQRPDHADTAHPKTTAVREERILDAVDDWLNALAAEGVSVKPTCRLLQHAVSGCPLRR